MGEVHLFYYRVYMVDALFNPPQEGILKGDEMNQGVKGIHSLIHYGSSSR